jgi:LDH2 family malate/lactate/ureidoglycolate dehydrogenase
MSAREVPAEPQASQSLVLAPEPLLKERVSDMLRSAGADEPSSEAATRALMHASRLGIDSHGVRLVAHYAKVLSGGRVNGRPQIAEHRLAPAAAVVDGDDGLGHLAAYRAMELACALARESGVGAVGVRRSSHFGAAGAYALAAAEQGFVGLCVTNADSIVALHDGTAPFHGTNPIAAAAPVPDARPWLLDMATSSIPLNRVHLYATLGRALPDGVAADATGRVTSEASLARMLLPLGGTDYGLKGAGLAGLVTVLSAVLTGAAIDPAMLPMTGTDDSSTPRNVGHFCLALRPEAFVAREVYDAAISQYLTALRRSPPRQDGRVLAPGDREWEVEKERLKAGIPLDHETARLLGLAGAT